MNELLMTTASAVAGFFAIMNPLANTPIFLGLTDDLSRRARTRVAIQAVLVAFVVVASFAAAGQALFSLFGITVAAFRIAGGIVVFMIGYRMLQGEHSAVQHTEKASAAGDAATEDGGAAAPEETGILPVAVSPLGVPLLAGPGTIATAVAYSSGGWGHVAATVLAFAALCLVTAVCFVFSDRVVALLGRSFLTVITRLMGLILAVIGTQMLLHGLHAAGF